MVEAAVVAGFLGLAEVGFVAYAAAFAINYAISVQVNRAFGEKPPSAGQDAGTRQQIPPSTSNALPVVYGDAYLGGTFVDAVLTTDQKNMYYVLAISNTSSNFDFSFNTSDMYYGDRKITFDATNRSKVISLTDDAGNVDTTINGYLYIGLYTSSESGVISIDNWDAPSVVMGPGFDIPTAQQWPSTGRQMNGTAFAIVKLIYSREAQTTSLQPITFHVSQKSAGLNRARPGDVWYDYMTNQYYGGAIDAAYVDTATRNALNTYSDELITFTDYNGNPATRRRYTINGVINAGQSVLSNIDTILSACDSWMAYSPPSGKWSLIINKAESTAYTFDDDNIIGELRVSATDITSSVNAIEAKFPNSQNKDQSAYVNIETPSGLLYPNEPINKATINLDMVNDSVQAHYLANRILEQAREDLIVSFNTTYYGIQVDAGDVVSVTNSGYGWTNKLFRVMRVNEISLADGSLGARLDMSEYNAQVYDNQDITQFTPVPNSGTPSPSFFSSLTFPIVTGYPTATVANFSVAVGIPATGRVTTINLYFTTATSPTPSDWKLLTSAYVSNSVPYTPSSTYTFTNQILSSGTYLIAYTVGNENSQSSLSGASSSFVWSPVGGVGPTGPTGSTGPTGGAGTQGTRSASGYLYYDASSSSAPSAPTVSGFNFTTGTFSSITYGWNTTFTAPPATSTSKFWAVRYAVSEATFGGTQTITLSSVFNWTNFDGLVTFTNLATDSGTTFIDGGNIITDTLTVDKISSGQTTSINGGYFGLGVGTLYGYTGVGRFDMQSGVRTALTCTYSNSTGSGLASLFMTRSPNSWGTSSYYATTDNYDAFATTAVTGGNVAGLFKYNQSITTSNNLSLPPRTIFVAGSVDWGGISEYIGPSGTYIQYQHVIAYLNSGSLSTYFSSPSAPSKRIYTATSSYAAYADSISGNNKIYSADGYLPFTGTHDGLYEGDIEIGDIFVDYLLIKKLDVSNVIMQYKKSSSANEKGVIGVCSKIYDQPPQDWDEFFVEPGPVDPNTGQSTTIEVPNPQYIPIPAGQRVINVNALGEGLINVCGEGGDIEIGDLIVTSSIAGKGMKQSDDFVRSITVAKSREAVTFASSTEVKQIACIYLGG